jgi:hypothetical protein
MILARDRQIPCVDWRRRAAQPRKAAQMTLLFESANFDETEAAI